MSRALDNTSLDQLNDPAHDVPLGESLMRHLYYTLAKDKFSATPHDYYQALVYAVRDRLIGRWISTQQRYYYEDCKRVYYLSMEFLTGRLLSNSLIGLGLLEECRDGLSSLHLDLDELTNIEWEAGLGNGGLGRLAACLLDSMATLGIPAYGYGLRYEYGIFRQRIVNGYQVEAPDNWLRFGNPWEIGRPEDLYTISYYGDVHVSDGNSGSGRASWIGSENVLAMAYDMPIPGYRNDTVNTLRLWAARSAQGFDLTRFNQGDYVDAVEDIDRTESISRVLYPDDSRFPGKELRLKQEYFLVSASIRDIVRRFKKVHSSFESFHTKVAIQLNDTHPALAIPELMRLLIDEESLTWETAWDITTRTFGYTNHTLLPEALEEWPVELLGRVLPRHLQIIYEINKRFLGAIAEQYREDWDRMRRMSLVAEDAVKRVRMSHLAIVGSHTVNGVSQLHSSLLRERMFSDFDRFFPNRFQNATNGITPRRWLMIANPGLTRLITDCIGDGWIRDLTQLKQLSPYADDASFRTQWADLKHQNKIQFAALVRHEFGTTINTNSLFDCQIKRIHEYKRQLLNVLHIVWHYIQLSDGMANDNTPRTFIFSGKTAPGYEMAKQIIKLINSVADMINNDPRVNQRLRVLFIPNYGVTLAERIIPAADLSEQISTAGTEASGTGNMKFALNGAITIGTLDGANIEIRDAVGSDNMFTFGLTAEEVVHWRNNGYDSHARAQREERLCRVIDLLRSPGFSNASDGAFEMLLKLTFERNDPYMVLADFPAYVDCHERVEHAYRDKDGWGRRSILNVANMGQFSSDETVLQYAHNIWKISVGE